MSILHRNRLVIVNIASRIRLATNGLNAAYTYQEVDVPDVRELFAYAEEVTVLGLTEQRTANHGWNVFFASGYTRTSEGSLVPLLAADIAASGSSRGAPYTTVASFNLETRLMLGAKNTSGTAAEFAVVSASLAFKLVGM